jgi:membrane protein DedA with SNARE-associated domain
VTAEHPMWLFAWVAVNQGGVPIPVVPSLVAAGALAGAGHASFATLVAVIVGASLVADLVWYGIGRWASPHVLRLLERLSGRAAARVKAAERHVLAHRLGFMLCCRFLPEVNPLAAALAGAARAAPGRYMLVSTMSALAWAGTWTGAGYALHHVAIAIAPARAEVAAFMLVIGVIVAAVFAVKRWRRGTVVRTCPLKELAMNSDSVETNVARASTKVSRGVVVRASFATKARLPSDARAQ